jgi:NAD(P)-dependent dehydrogenase (short-subunit alcohol dehydrogenase family)
MAGVAFVTGAGRGIGRAIALRLARAGLSVGVTDLDGETATDVANEILSTGGRAVARAADVTSLHAMRAAVWAVEGELGPITALVNNAGWDKMELFLENDPELWDRLLAINLKGVFNTTRAVLEGMAARGAGRSRLLRVQGGHHRLLEIARPRGRTEGHHGERRLPGADRHGAARRGRCERARREDRRGARARDPAATSR